MSTKKVLFCISALSVGGIETYLLRFLNTMHNEFSEVVVNCKHGYGGTLEDEYDQMNNVSITNIRLSYFNIISYYRFYHFLKKEQFDTICDFTGDFAGPVLFVAKIAGIKKRITFYRDSAYQFKMTFNKRVYLKIIRFLLKISATRILANSTFSMEVYQPPVSKEKIKIIHNGVTFREKNKTQQSIREELNIPQEAFVIGHVGSFREAKNHKTIIEIAKTLSKNQHNIKFLLVGEGVKDGLKDILKQENLKDYFITPGLRTDIPEMLATMDVFVFPSINEGQPNALIEAMIYEIPVLASNIPTIKECTPKSLHRFLFDPDNSSRFSDEITHIIDHGPMYDVKEVAGWARATFKSEHKFKEFYNEL